MLPIVVLCAFSAPPPVPAGHYVESRTAAVFAGACHFNGEWCTEGREALCVWHFDEGVHAGVDLAGIDVALSLRAEANLAAPEASVARRVYLSSGETPERRAAALALLRTREPALFAGAEVLEPIALEARFTDDGGYAVRGGRLFELSGAALPDRACCRMPLQVWYAPFATLTERVVGDNQTFVMRDTRLGRVFSRAGENAAFTGRFRFGDGSPAR